MVGLIQKILFDMIRELKGEPGLKDIKKLAGLPEDLEFQIDRVYSDEEWQRLLSVTLDYLNITMEQAMAAYADFFLKDALKRFPVWFEMSKNSYEFLLIQPTIHNCFATGVADKTSRSEINDKFKIDKYPNKIVTHYRSKNGHCDLYIELAKSVLRHYKDEALIEQKKCSKHGDDECEIHVAWTKLGGETVAAQRE